MKVLVMGAAGFIGYHTTRALLVRVDEVVGHDTLNDYHDVALKEARLNILRQMPGFQFVKCSLEDRDGVTRVFKDHGPERVVNLAAQPGVRYGMTNPHSYADSNLVGFLNILEGFR